MRPNVLFIIVDDLNAWIGALGRHPQVKTPNIDALAARGTLFVNAYCSAPYCNASRMGLFTGRLPSRLGVYVNEPFWERAERPLTLMEHLRGAGYLSVGAGKVFHGVFDYDAAGYDRLDHAPWREIENRCAAWDWFNENEAEPLPTGRPLNGLFDARDFDAVPHVYRHFDWGPLDNHREMDTPDAKVASAVEHFLQNKPREPFFCAAGLYKPHLPWHAPQRFFDLYPGVVALPVVKDDDLDDVPPIGRDWALNPPDHALVTGRGVWPEAVKGYLACISFADAMVGRILAALDASGVADRTAIVLCGDNGFHLGEKLHWRKFALWEEATRVPLIYAAAGGSKARRVIEPVSLLDIFPSILRLADITVPECDGQSFLEPGAGSRAVPVVSTWGPSNHSLREGSHRFIQYSDGSEELYDHASDPHEWTNLARESGHADLLVSMRARLAQAV